MSENKKKILEMEKESLIILKSRFLDLSSDFKKLYKMWKTDFLVMLFVFLISFIGLAIFILEKNVILSITFTLLLTIFYVTSIISLIHMSNCRDEASYCERQARKIQQLIHKVEQFQAKQKTVK